MATVIMECLHEVYQDEQRHRRLAPWTESPRNWKVATSIVWLVCSTMRPVWLHFKSGSFQRGSYGTFSRRSSGTSKRRSSLYGMRLTLGTAVQESSWRRARTLTAQQLPKSTLHSVDSLLSCQHCITLDIARYKPKTAPLGATISIKVMTYAMPLCLY